MPNKINDLDFLGGGRETRRMEGKVWLEQRAHELRQILNDKGT